MASTVFILAYIELLSGDRAKCRREVELSYSLLNDPLVGMSNKLTLRVMHICKLSMHGDNLNYFHQQQLIRDSIDERVVKQTVAAPYFYVWGCSCFISTGQTAKALDLINKGVNVSATAKSEHMLSQMLQWQAYVLAIHGNIQTAEIKIGESAGLREIAGGPFYQSFHCILAGAVYTRTKNKKMARACFARGLEIASAIPSPYLQACGLIHRSYFQFMSFGEKAALPDLTNGLTIMEANDYDHFWSWEPQTMLQLLALAVKNDILKTFSLKLARKRLQVNISDDGEIIPLMQFTLLDTFHVKVGNDYQLDSSHFTPLQRELLGILLISKNKQIAQDTIQLILWPESNPQKSRKKFDTLLGRLRATLADNLPGSLNHYIVLNKGILCLLNAATDIDEFLKNCKEGLKLSNNNEFWQAGNRFYTALSFWKGSLPSDIFRNDSIYSFEDSLLATFEKVSLRWARILADTGDIQEAIPLLVTMLKHNGLEEKGVLLLCRLYNQTHQPLKVRETLQHYITALKLAEYDDNEIKSMIDDLTDSMGKE
jgi:DNA-binding SARP family transcriptional activator